MKKKVISYLLLITLYASNIAMAQSYNIATSEHYNSVQTRLGAHFNYVPVRGVTLSITPEVYLDLYNTENDTTKIMNRLGGTFEAAYRVNQYFRTAIYYTCLGTYHNSKEGKGVSRFWECKHRVGVDVTGYLPIGRFTISLREQFRTTFRPMIYNETYYNSAEKLFASMEIRSRLKLSYKAFSKPISPFLSIEMINPLNHNTYITSYLTLADYWLSAVHARIGLDWRLDKYSKLTFYYEYSYSKEYDVDIKKSGNIKFTPEYSNRHIIGVYYSISF